MSRGRTEEGGGSREDAGGENKEGRCGRWGAGTMTQALKTLM